MGAKGLCSALVVGVVLWPMTASLGTAQSVAVREESATGTRQALITVSVKQAPLAKVLREIAAQANLAVAFPDRVKQSAVRVTVDVHDLPLDQVLAKVLEGTGVKASVVSGALVFINGATAVSAPVAQGGIFGKVIDEKTKQGLRGAMITIDGNNKGTTSGDGGEFRFANVIPGEHTAHVKMLGYMKTTKTVIVVEGQTAVLTVVLVSSVSALDQVVVTGTVTPTELKAVPSAITIITAKQIEERGITRIDQLFRGDIPGLFAQNSGAAALEGDAVTMFSRGATALAAAPAGGVNPIGPSSGTNAIKTYIDGIEMADSRYISQIDPKSIERIEILTGPQASTVYGSNAINGVMQIFTKRGAGSRPKLTFNLMSGWIESDFRRSLTPNHDYSGEVNGVEGRLSYNVGGSWNHIGAWTPAEQTTRINKFAGLRAEFPTRVGTFTGDMTYRDTDRKNKQGGSVSQGAVALQEEGWYVVNAGAGIARPFTYLSDGETWGGKLSYAPTRWWSHEVSIGQDASNDEQLPGIPSYGSPSDTVMSYFQSNFTRRSASYVTAVHIPLASLAQLSVTTGADAWRTFYALSSASSTMLTGVLASPSLSRYRDKNKGAFLQTQLGINDRLFFTYGLRAEWNPGFGDDASPNYAPRYGISYTHDFGFVTTKLRASYGRSTRPPQQKLKDSTLLANSSLSAAVTAYGNIAQQLANSELAPEHQQGGEGGVELYWGSRGSLIVTRFNQTVDGLIARPRVDSARSINPNPVVSGLTCTQAINFGTDYCLSQDAAGYGYIGRFQYVNIGSIRNQGWELQGSVSAGPFTTRGTYSWTKSRTLGVNPRYRNAFPPSVASKYQPGASFAYLAEHTWAASVTYARAKTTIALNLTGVGEIRTNRDDFSLQYLMPSIRSLNNRYRMNADFYTNFNKAYTLADLNASRSVTDDIEGLFQVLNIGNTYKNDKDSDYAVMGRQTKLGLRIRM